jgi:hypothetical protein
MYSTDHAGRYPGSLATLTPNYLRVVPNCPAAREDTYSASYEFSTNPDACTIFCRGHHHEAPNEPHWSSYQGLIER